MKEFASINIPSVSVTLDTFQLFSGWLKDSAPQNINFIFVTLDTFQLLSGWLKDTAPSSSNIFSMFVTLDTSQFLISPYFVKVARRARLRVARGPILGLAGLAAVATRNAGARGEWAVGGVGHGTANVARSPKFTSYSTQFSHEQ